MGQRDHPVLAIRLGEAGDRIGIEEIRTRQHEDGEPIVLRDKASTYGAQQAEDDRRCQ